MTAYLRAVVTIAHKDLRIEMRTRETVLASLIMTVLVALVFAIALDLAPTTARAVAPGLLWATLAFAGVPTLGRSFTTERDRGALDGLFLAPIDPTALYLGKMLGNLAFMLVTLAVALPVFSALLGVDLISWAVVLAAFLGTLGFAAAGTLFAALALGARARDVLLPALFLPLAVPIILTAAAATRLGMANASTSDANGVLAACDTLYITTALLLFSYTLEE